MTSAHQAGGPNERTPARRTIQSQRVLENQRQAAIEQQEQRKREREVYFRELATKLAVECGLSQKIALERVRAFSVLARQESEAETVRNTFGSARFG
jgi:hypothetical protein